MAAFWRKDDKAKKKAERAARAATAEFEAQQDVARRKKEAHDSARLARFEIQGRGFRPVFGRVSVGGGSSSNDSSRTAPLISLHTGNLLGGGFR